MNPRQALGHIRYALKRAEPSTLVATIRTVPAFAPKYTPEQREAMAVATVDKGIKPARRVVERAAAGELVLDGQKLEPFETNENTVRDCARHLRKRRAGKVESTLAAMPPRDAIDALRRRLLAVCDHELEAIERRKRGGVDLERVRQIARAAREAAALPGPDEGRGTQPGQRSAQTGQKVGNKTQGGLAGAILAASGNGDRVETHEEKAATGHAPKSGADGGESSDAAALIREESEQDRGSPGAWARERVLAEQA